MASASGRVQARERGRVRTVTNGLTVCTTVRLLVPEAQMEPNPKMEENRKWAQEELRRAFAHKARMDKFKEWAFIALSAAWWLTVVVGGYILLRNYAVALWRAL